MNNIIAHKLCSIQGRLFELSVRRGLESNEFAKVYMKSDIAAKFNSAYDRSQWMGEEYLLGELTETHPLPEGKTYSADVMFWMGYTYAVWSIVYGDPCKNIIKMAGPRVMAENYAGLHTVSAEMAIQDLKAQYWSQGDHGAKLREEVVKKVIKDALNSRGEITEYQQFLNSLGVDILFYLKNESCRNEYKKQLDHYQQYIKRRMYMTYIDYLLESIDKAEIPPKEKAEYFYVVKNIAKSAQERGLSRKEFIFFDSLESRLKQI